MKSKLTNYLNKEYESLRDILMQTKEIAKSIANEDFDYADKLIAGRGENISKAMKFHDAVIKIFDRDTYGFSSKDKKINSLRSKIIELLSEINSIDAKINKAIKIELDNSKEGYKKAKELNLFKNSYTRNKGLPPKLFDKKS